MRQLAVLSLSLFFTAQALASYQVIGETRECTLQAKVLKKTTDRESSLLVIHQSEVYELELTGELESMQVYESKLASPAPRTSMTFQARIMRPEMSRLSELSIYLSGVKQDCLIER